VSDTLILRSSAGGGLDFDSVSYGGGDGSRAGPFAEPFDLIFRIIPPMPCWTRRVQ
jgi:hypothetical protein